MPKVTLPCFSDYEKHWIGSFKKSAIYSGYHLIEKNNLNNSIFFSRLRFTMREEGRSGRLFMYPE
jgi:hypothetical protein